MKKGAVHVQSHQSHPIVDVSEALGPRQVGKAHMTYATKAAKIVHSRQQYSSSIQECEQGDDRKRYQLVIQAPTRCAPNRPMNCSPVLPMGK
jgi:hypothetical protein